MQTSQMPKDVKNLQELEKMSWGSKRKSRPRHVNTKQLSKKAVNDKKGRQSEN